MIYYADKFLKETLDPDAYDKLRTTPPNLKQEDVIEVEKVHKRISVSADVCENIGMDMFKGFLRHQLSEALADAISKNYASYVFVGLQSSFPDFAEMLVYIAEALVVTSFGESFIEKGDED